MRSTRRGVGGQEALLLQLLPSLRCRSLRSSLVAQEQPLVRPLPFGEGRAGASDAPPPHAELPPPSVMAAV